MVLQGRLCGRVGRRRSFLGPQVLDLGHFFWITPKWHTIADLTRKRTCLLSDTALASVGWLAKGQTYARGELVDGFLFKLVELLVHPWAPAHAMGWHECDLCRLEAGPRTLRVFSPSGGTLEVERWTSPT